VITHKSSLGFAKRDDAVPGQCTEDRRSGKIPKPKARSLAHHRCYVSLCQLLANACIATFSSRLEAQGNTRRPAIEKWASGVVRPTGTSNKDHERPGYEPSREHELVPLGAGSLGLGVGRVVVRQGWSLAAHEAAGSPLEPVWATP
jgi:hypothetical protein